jgi:hypothetical protein
MEWPPLKENEFIKYAKSEKGTAIKIPINNAESVSDNVFLFCDCSRKIQLKNGITCQKITMV